MGGLFGAVPTNLHPICILLALHAAPTMYALRVMPAMFAWTAVFQVAFPPESAGQVTTSIAKTADSVRLSHSGQGAVCCIAPGCLAGPLALPTSGWAAPLGPFVNFVAAHASHVAAPTPHAPPCNARVVAHVQVVLPPADLLLDGAMPMGCR